MPDTTAPATRTLDVAALVRRCLLASGAELVTALDELAPADRRRQRALDRWFAGYAEQLRRHHELLDSMVVPALASRGVLDDDALETLASDHAWIDQLLSDLGDALGILSFGLGAEPFWIGRASDLAATLHHVLGIQLAREGQLLTPLVERALDASEREVLKRETIRGVATGPLRFSLAWLYAHLDEAEREAVAAYAPATSRLTYRSRRGRDGRTAVAALG